MVRTQLAGRGIGDHRVLEAMRRVARHRFVPDVPLERAYGDPPLSIGNGQTMSQPWIVARMSELLVVAEGQSVLEVGTGSGYQAAVLAEMGARVLTLERDPVLAERSRRRLAALMPEAPIEVRVGDGTLGAADRAPWARILVTAGAPPEPPPALLEQLADPGRMVIPLGERGCERLSVVVREGGRESRVSDVACRFVPLIGEGGWG